jgi:hypothetical protein
MKSTNTSAAWSIGFMVFLVFMVYAIFGGEQTGTVRTDDCRTKVRIESSALMTWYHKFTCESDGTGKTCAYVTTADHGVCETAYVYFVSAPAPQPTPPPTPPDPAQQRHHETPGQQITVGMILVIAVGSIGYMLWSWRHWLKATPTAAPAPPDAAPVDIMTALKRSLEIMKKKS